MPPKSNKLKTNKRKEEKKLPAKKNTKASKKSKKPVRSVRKKSTPLDPRWVRAAGFFIILVSFYLALAFTSFFFNWFDSNPSNILSQSLGLGHYFNDHAQLVRNWTGNVGAFLSKWLVLNAFGIGAFGFIPAILVMIHYQFNFKRKKKTGDFSDEDNAPLPSSHRSEDKYNTVEFAVEEEEAVKAQREDHPMEANRLKPTEKETPVQPDEELP